VRWRIVALLMVYVALAQFNRISITVAGKEQITRHHGISDPQMGVVYSAFLLAYTLCMIPGGWLIDRRGPRLALLLLGLGSVAFIALTGFVGLTVDRGLPLLVGLLVARTLMGAVNAPLHPAAARAVSFWMPFPQRSLGNGLVTGAALVGISLAPLGFGLLMDGVGWPGAFMISAGLTALLTCVWAVAAADQPAEHPAVNRVERSLIEDSDPELPASHLPGGPTRGIDQALAAAPTLAARQILALLRTRTLLLLTVSYAALGYFQYLFFYWAQGYFTEALGVEDKVSRSYAALPGLGMMAGMFLGGGISSWLQGRLGYRLGRVVLPIVALVAGAGLLYLGTRTLEARVAVTCFTLAMAAAGAAEAPFWSTAVEVGGRCGGMGAAILNTGGNLGGLVAPIVTPILAGYLDWQASFGLAAVIAFVGALCWFGVDPAQRTGAGMEPTNLSEE
jgi:MFS family permease